MWYLSLNRLWFSSTKLSIWTQQPKTAKGRGKQIQIVRAAIILPLGTETIFTQKESLQRQHFHICLYNATHTYTHKKNDLLGKIYNKVDVYQLSLKNHPKIARANMFISLSFSPHLLNFHSVTRYRG